MNIFHAYKFLRYCFVMAVFLSAAERLPAQSNAIIPSGVEKIQRKGDSIGPAKAGFENPFEQSGGEGVAASDMERLRDSARSSCGVSSVNPFAAPRADAQKQLSPKDPPFWYPLVVWQKAMNEKLSSTLKSLKENFSFWNVLIIFMVSLIYAIGHTAGPGHGKVILGTFFLTSDIKRQKRDAAIAGGIVSVTHIGMAFLLSLILYLIIHSLSMGSQRDMAEISKRIGGGFVVLTGVVLMLITLFRKKISFLSIDKNRQKFDKYSLYTIAVLAGIVPCPLAWFVLVFSISFDIYIYGIISIIGMAIGAAITVTTASYISIVGRDTALSMVSAEKVTTIGYWLRFAGGVVLVLAGTLMVLPSQ